MSEDSDDDIWSRVRKEAAAKTALAQADAASLDIAMEPAQTTRGNLEKRQASEAATTKLAWETTEEEIDGPPPPSKRRRRSRPAPGFLIGSTLVSLLWVIGAGLFLLQNATTFGSDGSSLLFSLVVLLLGPAFSLLAGFMGESIAKSGREARTLINAARKMLEPDQTGERAVRSTAMAVRSEIGQLEGAIGGITDRLRLIEGDVGNHVRALTIAGQNARSGADQLVAGMESERQRLDALLAAMAELMTRAQKSTQFAGQSVDERASRLASATDALLEQSSRASQAATGAAQHLDIAAQRAVEAIEQLDQATERGEEALARTHDLIVMARMRADEAASSVNTAVSSLHDAAQTATQTARSASQTIQNETAANRDAGFATIEAIAAATMAHAQKVTEALRIEAEAARTAGAETLAALQTSAQAVRIAAEDARQQSSQQLIDHQRRLDSVRQTAFEAGKDADSFMQTRITDARALIEQSAGLLDETGTKIQERFSRLAAACADQARAVEDLLDGLNRRLENLPQEANARAQAIEAAMSETLNRLTEAGRKAAQETAALDSAFQDRLRDSYSALGEVVQRLGGLSGVLPMPLAGPVAMPVPTVEQPAASRPAAPLEPMMDLALQKAAPAAPPKTVPNAPSPSTPIERDKAKPEKSKVEPNAFAQSSAVQEEELGIRTSGLKISSPVPIEDDPFAELQIGRPPTTIVGGDNGWSWKQVLSTLDRKGSQTDHGWMTDLVGELGLEATVTNGTLEKLSAMAGRSPDQARRGTRDILTEEVRVMRRKLTTEPDLRANLVRFVEAKRQAAAQERLEGNEARLYFVADAALEA